MTGIYKIFLITVFSLMLIPVCSVIAGKSRPTYSVAMPVVHPVYFKSIPKYSVGQSVRRDVVDVVLSADKIVSEESNGPSYKAFVEPRPSHQVAQVMEKKAAEPVYEDKTPEDHKSPDVKSSTAHNEPAEFVTSSGGVSIFPGDKENIRKESVSEDGGFFTTPKRMLGLSGKRVRFKPSLSIVETYDSNVDYRDISDLVTTYKPALTFDAKNEDSKIHFRGDFIYRDFMEHSGLDRYDYNLAVSGEYRFNPVLDGALTVEHRRRHNLDQNTAEVGAVHLDPSIILSTVATPELNWVITPRDKVRFVYSIDKTDYERASDSDYINHSLSTVWAHALKDERTSFFLGQLNVLTHYTREMDDLNGDQYSNQAIFGVEHAFTESWKFSLKGGPGITFSNYSSENDRDDGTDFMYQFRAELEYNRPMYNARSSIERLVRPGRYGENEIMDKAEIYFRYKFTEDVVQSFVASYWLLEGEGIGATEDHKSRGTFFQSVTNWDMDKDWRLFLGLNFTDNYNRITEKTSQRFKSWIGISYAFPTELR
ncbi:hypothetical protein [Maridesulfovibrio bastinii]|uniref:hypothetical protein n=1 Tax=Maridesulfovibrio bastinii TaxID=47157 RepID=UPI00041E8DEF|nr:hypothetical protein [Maridesulfovibrio bastinii]